MQAVVGGLITTFDTGIEGVISVANDEALMHDLPLNRMVPATGAGIFGTFFLAGDGINFHSLSDEEIEQCRAVFNEPLISANPSNEKPKTLRVVVVPPSAEPYTLAIGNSLEEIEALLGGPPAAFDAGIDGMLGIANADAKRDGFALCRFTNNESHGPTHGTFILIAIDSNPSGYTSLTPKQRETCITAFSLKVEVVVFPPDATPYIATITSNPETGYLPDLQRLIACADINTARLFNVSTFETPVPGTVGLCHKSNTDGTVLSINENHFPPNRRVVYMPSMFYGIFVVAAGVRAWTT